MTNKAYDTLKLVALIAVPAATFMSTILKIWDVPCATQITATLAALDTFLGALVAALKAQYSKREG